DQDEWRFRPAQTLAPLPDGYIAAEEDVLAFGVESLKTRERGAETRAVPDLAREDPALFEPVAQATFDLLCEFVRAVVGLEAGDKLSARRLEPALEKAFQRGPLLLDLAALWIIERNHGIAWIAKDIDVRQRRAAVALRDGAQDLIRRAGGIRLPVRLPLEIRRQGRAKPGAEDGNHEVAVSRLGNLVLEGFVRGVEMV